MPLLSRILMCTCSENTIKSQICVTPQMFEKDREVSTFVQSASTLSTNFVFKSKSIDFNSRNVAFFLRFVFYQSTEI